MSGSLNQESTVFRPGSFKREVMESLRQRIRKEFCWKVQGSNGIVVGNASFRNVAIMDPESVIVRPR